MEEALTYQQVLADVYEENAKDVLVCPNDDYSDIGPEDKHPDELENQEAFRGEQIGHQIASVQPDPPKYEDRTIQSIKYRKETQVTVLNVDSRFRVNRAEPSTNFLFRLLDPIKNVISIRLASAEIPNSFYAFSSARNNVSFYLAYPSGTTATLITIGNGNYSQNPIPRYQLNFDRSSKCYDCRISHSQFFCSSGLCVWIDNNFLWKRNF